MSGQSPLRILPGKDPALIEWRTQAARAPAGRPPGVQDVSWDRVSGYPATRNYPVGAAR